MRNNNNYSNILRNLIAGAILFSAVVAAAEDQVLSNNNSTMNFGAEHYCHNRILNGSDSAYIKVSNQDESPIDEAKARNVVEVVRKHFECRQDELVVQDVVCMRGLDQVLNSDICRVNAVEGYFIILQDYVGGFNVLFNRWD